MFLINTPMCSATYYNSYSDHVVSKKKSFGLNCVYWDPRFTLSKLEMPKEILTLSKRKWNIYLLQFFPLFWTHLQAVALLHKVFQYLFLLLLWKEWGKQDRNFITWFNIWSVLEITNYTSHIQREKQHKGIPSCWHYHVDTWYCCSSSHSFISCSI